LGKLRAVKSNVDTGSRTFQKKVRRTTGDSDLVLPEMNLFNKQFPGDSILRTAQQRKYV